MIRHERLRPPSRDYPADEWSVVEKAFHPEFLAQLVRPSSKHCLACSRRGVEPLLAQEIDRS